MDKQEAAREKAEAARRKVAVNEFVSAAATETKKSEGGLLAPQADGQHDDITALELHESSEAVDAKTEPGARSEATVAVNAPSQQSLDRAGTANNTVSSNEGGTSSSSDQRVQRTDMSTGMDDGDDHTSVLSRRSSVVDETAVDEVDIVANTEPGTSFIDQGGKAASDSLQSTDSPELGSGEDVTLNTNGNALPVTSTLLAKSDSFRDLRVNIAGQAPATAPPSQAKALPTEGVANGTVLPAFPNNPVGQNRFRANESGKNSEPSSPAASPVSSFSSANRCVLS